METKDLFEHYIFPWMCEDIEREIRWARAKESAGNALCALGLLAYTEFMGTLLPPIRRPTGGARQHFDAYFRELGPSYASFLDGSGINVYDVFRCGLAHEYFTKGTCTIAMLNSTPGDFEVKGAWDATVSPPSRGPSSFVKKPVARGIGLAPNGSFYFIVEKYYEDFRASCERLYSELLSLTPQRIIFIPLRPLSDSG